MSSCIVQKLRLVDSIGQGYWVHFSIDLCQDPSRCKSGVVGQFGEFLEALEKLQRFYLVEDFGKSRQSG